MTTAEKIKALRETDLFGRISANSLKELAQVSSERRLQRGGILFTAGEPAAGMFVVVSGRLRAFRQTAEGREQTIHVESAGATLAEVPVFDEGPYPSTVQAEEETVALFVPKDAIRRFLLENPEAALAALEMLARRLRQVTGLAESLSLRDVAQRLAAMLVEEALKQDNDLRDGVSFSMSMPHQSIAARLGSVREVITRLLHKLANEGVIAIRGHRIVILNAEALKARAGSVSERQPIRS